MDNQPQPTPVVPPNNDKSGDLSSPAPQSAPTQLPANPQVSQPQSTAYEPPQYQQPQPQAGVVMGEGQINVQNSPPKHRKNKSLIISVVIVIALVGAGAVFTLLGLHKSTKLNCTPPAGATADKATAIKLYGQVVDAIKASDQACVNALSSDFFLSYNKQVASPPSGNWITYDPTGVGPLTGDFSKLPSALVNSDFVEKDYSRTQVQTSNGGNASYYHPAQGIQLRYPAGITRSSDNGEEKFYFFFGFVSQNGKVVIDNFIEGPADSF